MKTFLILIAMVMAACGSDDKTENQAPAPTVRAASADLSEASPTASIGFDDCRLDVDKAEVDSRTDTEVTLDGQTLSHRYDTENGPFFLSDGKTISMQVFETRGFVRVSITCPL